MGHAVPKNKITILLVDDHTLIRHAWLFILNSDPRFQVIGETHSSDEAVTIVKSRRPQVILMDINMSPMDGFQTTELVLQYAPGTKVIGVSMHTMPAYVRKMMKSGALGYVTKNSSKQELLEAILEVSRGKKYICKEVKDILAEQELDVDKDTDLNVLTQRELQIAGLIKKGLTSKEVALELKLSLKTVEVHRYNILKKLKLNNIASLVNYLNARGM